MCFLKENFQQKTQKKFRIYCIYLFLLILQESAEIISDELLLHDKACPSKSFHTQKWLHLLRMDR